MLPAELWGGNPRVQGGERQPRLVRPWRLLLRPVSYEAARGIARTNHHTPHHGWAPFVLFLLLWGAPPPIVCIIGLSGVPQTEPDLKHALYIDPVSGYTLWPFRSSHRSCAHRCVTARRRPAWSVLQFRSVQLFYFIFSIIIFKVQFSSVHSICNS